MTGPPATPLQPVRAGRICAPDGKSSSTLLDLRFTLGQLDDDGRPYPTKPPEERGHPVECPELAVVRAVQPCFLNQKEGPAPVARGGPFVSLRPLRGAANRQ